MNENRPGRFIVDYLARFFSSKHEATKRVDNLLKKKPGLSKHEVFRQLSEGRGAPSTHVSGKPEGKIKGS